MICKDCRRCQYFIDGLTSHRCRHPDVNKEIVYFRRDCEYYVLHIRYAIERLNKRKRLLENFHTVDVSKDIEALDRAINIMREMNP